MKTNFKICLTVEQSATLIAKGISADKASEIKEYDDDVSKWTHRGAPIFTLADILSLLPKEIEIDAHRCGLNIWYHNAHYWMVSYIQFDGSEIAYQSKVVARDNLIDALYEFICMCIKDMLIDLPK